MQPTAGRFDALRSVTSTLPVQIMLAPASGS